MQAQQPPQHNGAWGAYQTQQSLQSLPNRNDVNQSQSSPYSNMNARQTKTPQPSQSLSIPPAHSQPQVQVPLQAPQTFQMPSQQQQQQQQTTIGQENVVRVFDELMKNIARMKMFVRPSMCKPYGKQSESLQKSEFPFTTRKKYLFLHKNVHFMFFSVFSINRYNSNCSIIAELHTRSNDPN